MNDDWRNEKHRWKDLKRVELGRRDNKQRRIYARAYFKQRAEFRWIPVFVHGNRELQWLDYFCGTTLDIPGGTLYPRPEREAGDDNLIDVISQIEDIEEGLKATTHIRGGTMKQARASMLLDAFHCPAHEARKRMRIADPRRVHELAKEFTTLFKSADDFTAIDCDRGDVVDLAKKE